MSGYSLLVALGYFFVGLALITLIGANWDDIPRGVRMTALVVLTTVTQCLGLKFFLNDRTDTAQRIFFLGNIFYGASIILIAQIYHLGEHMADGVFWWALGTLPFALLLPTLLLGLQTFALALIWFWMEVTSGFYPALFPVFVAGSAFVLWRGTSNAWLFLITVLSAIFHLQYSLAVGWSVYGRPEFSIESALIAIATCVLTYSIGASMSQRVTQKVKTYGATLTSWSLRFSLLFLFIMSFAEPWKELLSADIDHFTSMSVVLLLCWTVAILVSRSAGQTRKVALLLAVNVLLVTIALTVQPQAAVTLQVIDNLALVGIGVVMILNGVRHGTSRSFFLGLSVILVTAFFRYINLIGDYVGGAVLFIVFAAVMLGAARYWRHHQELSARSGDAT